MVLKAAIPMIAILALSFATRAMSRAETFRPPAVPLVTHDPYFSTWSMADKLTDDWPKHWTGGITGMGGVARIDGKTYRFMGAAPGFSSPET